MTDYETFYAAEGPGSLGAATKWLTRLIPTLITPGARVLDVGAGQGRDALWLAAKGFDVVAFDPSPTGVAQMAAEAKTSGLNLAAHVADAETFEPAEAFDLVLFDRILHMMPPVPRLAAFARLAEAVSPGGYIVVLDEGGNIPGLRQVLQGWDVTARGKTAFWARRPD